MRLLVTGGAGYIGSVVTAHLLAAGHQVTVLDDLSTGYQDAVPPGAAFVRGTIRDQAASVLAERDIEAVLHFAAHSLVGESVANPAKYWANNLGGTLALLDAMRLAGTPRIIFSSTAAVYGEPERTPVEETCSDPADQPVRGLEASRGHGADRVRPAARPRRGQPALLQRGRRAAGRRRRLAPERHSPETHLIPNVLAAAADGRGIQVFGDDYPTPDGTCIRDYIHVTDLADAHLRALGACEPRPAPHLQPRQRGWLLRA